MLATLYPDRFFCRLMFFIVVYQKFRFYFLPESFWQEGILRKGGRGRVSRSEGAADLKVFQLA